MYWSKSPVYNLNDDAHLYNALSYNAWYWVNTISKDGKVLLHV